MAQVKPGQDKQWDICSHGQHTYGKSGNMIDKERHAYGTSGGHMSRFYKCMGTYVVDQYPSNKQYQIFPFLLKQRFQSCIPPLKNPPERPDIRPTGGSII